MDQAANRTAPAPALARANAMPFGATATICPVATQIDGRTTVGFRVAAADGRARPVVVGIAGASRPTMVLFGTALALADAFDLLLVDMPGFNGSGPAASPRLELFAAHVADLVRAELGGRDLLFLGESFGGCVAMEAARRLEPEMPVRALALVDPPLSRAAQLRARSYLHVMFAADPSRDTPFLREYADGDGFIRDDDPDVYWRLLRDTGAARGVLILAGGRAGDDTSAAPAALFTPADAMRAAECVPGDLAVLRLEKAGHSVLQETPDEAAAALREFFRARC